jgi:hypothetical protein
MALTDLQNIPRVMRKKGWNAGARLQETWFKRPAKAARGLDGSLTADVLNSYTDPVTISIDWALRFPRAQDAYTRLLSDDIWRTDEARSTLATRLRNAGLLAPLPGRAAFDTPLRSFGDSSLSALEMYNNRVYRQPVNYGTEYWIPVLDEMVAALGRFNFWLTAMGTVGPVPNPAGLADLTAFLVTVEDVAVYIVDSFDFNGYQYLGAWSDDDVVMQPVNDPDESFTDSGNDLMSVFNSTYRDWRSKHNMGGDFLVVSDVRIVTLNRSPTFRIWANGSVELVPDTKFPPR